MLLIDIALGHLGRRRRQSIVSIAGVALGVGFFIAISALMQGFQDYFVATIIDVQPHIVMKDEFRSAPQQPVMQAYDGGAVALTGVKPKDEPRGIRNGKAIVESLSRLPGIVVAPTLSGQALLRYGSKDVSATLMGVEPDRERQVSNIESDMVVGTLDDLYTTANGLILGVGLAGKLGAGPGDTLAVVAPSGAALKMKVVGLFQTGITGLDDVIGYTLLKKAQVLQDRANIVNQIRMRVADVEGAERIAAEIEARFGYWTESWQETNRNVLDIFIIQNAIMYSTTGAILVVAAFGIFNIISTVVLEKTRDIAILKSIGLEEGDIQRIFLLEGLLVGVVGAALGAGVGYGLTEILASIQLPVGGFVRHRGFVLSYSVVHYLIAGGAAITAAALAAYLPARKAARLNPVDIIRGAA
jgi:lipoprotein-releasing system permease protein